MDSDKKNKIFYEFARFITPERREKIERYAQERTRYVTVVLEDVFQERNCSAVLRTCDCFGIQDVHIIEDRHRFVVSSDIAKGSSQWLSLFRYGNEKEHCFKKLRDNGYKIVATTPHEKDLLIEDLPLDTKVALVFGTEQQGLSAYALEHADTYVKIPMYGFTESFNISVCAGIALYELTKRLRHSAIPWRLSPGELIDLKLQWLGTTTDRTEQIEHLLSEK